jgi:hypothetical protein
MTRRDFLKNMLWAGAVTAIPIKAIDWLQPKPEPIKKSLMYNALEKKLLMVDELPQGALARYERDVAVKSYVMPKRGTVPTEIIN